MLLCISEVPTTWPWAIHVPDHGVCRYVVGRFPGHLVCFFFVVFLIAADALSLSPRALPEITRQFRRNPSSKKFVRYIFALALLDLIRGQ